jgi:tripartite-type tricarboxylate transporter receptor subunit TctC
MDASLMGVSMRVTGILTAACAALACTAFLAFGLGDIAAVAQPTGQSSKTLKIIVPYTPGSGPDIISRLLGEQIASAGGPTVVIENRPGGGMTIGTEAAARAAPDGNTLLLVANAFTVNAAMKRGHVTLADFEPVCQLASTPMPLVVQSSAPWKTVQELVADAKAHPGKITFASGGPATSLHVAIEVLKLATKIDANYVPYGGTAPAINTLLGGHVQAVWADYPTVVPYLKSGVLRALVTTSPKRSEAMPNVPTLTETGITKYEAEIFYGLVAPAKTPAPAIERLSGLLLAAMKTPAMKAKFDQQGLFASGTCGAPFGTFLKNIIADYERITTAAGIKAN